MDPKDDPEARIRELERPLADAARTSELGAGGSSNFPPPPPGPPTPWPGYAPYPAPPQPRRGGATTVFLILLAALTMILVGGGIAADLMFTGSRDTDTSSDSPTMTARKSTPTRAPVPEPVAPSQIPAGQTVIVSGIGENRTIECQDHTVIVSGVENLLEITGHCAAVTVSGVNNTITVESVDTIGVSGFENRVTFHTGQPDVANSGQSNVVEQG